MDGTRRGVIGLGHDLQLISELEGASALREPGVFFTSGELRRLASTESLAGGFSAKEALFKALPTGTTWFWTEAELVHDSSGAPRFHTHGSLASLIARRRLRVHVSISHSGGWASAVVVVSGESGFLGTIDRMVRRVLQRVTATAAGAPQ